ncbi:GvpL/GvpF family gas vesicle protein [Halococcus saccharolyticus]|uniref:Gas vesicle synthesis protein GvpLGvpF n=1 Tax=Halococcus saccharolyticus DSM 5350 TaxID=1227455 RepID=M0MMG2_9EURY|nr:GvpL/GvpF family gas vesicle protein [Halococcus saccharolyticus]EMA46533.1 gas vesicle synthesis protein GvpLGvpF [Halococcus saccharolyticus DSM 5350]
MASTHLYTYGITDDEVEFETEGVGDATRVYAVEHGSLAAIVSDSETMEPDRSDENLRAHDDVLQELLYRDGGRTVVPMQFGMVFKNARALKGVLRGGRRAFRKALNDVEGRVELGLKILADEGATVDREAIAASVEERLGPVNDGEADNGLFSDRLVLNRSYLVERDDRAAFDEAVDEIIDEYGEEFTVQYTGPWAPYSFVDIEIGAKR